MLIEIDGAVRDYAFGMIASIVHMRLASDEKLQSKILMNMIKLGANVGFIDHQFDQSKRLDRFTATSKLIGDWGEVFPNKHPPSDARARLEVQIIGKRNFYFKAGQFVAIPSMSDWRALK